MSCETVRDPFWIPLPLRTNSLSVPPFFPNRILCVDLHFLYIQRIKARVSERFYTFADTEKERCGQLETVNNETIIEKIPIVLPVYSPDLGAVFLHAATYPTRRCTVYGQMGAHDNVLRNVPGDMDRVSSSAPNGRMEAIADAELGSAHRNERSYRTVAGLLYGRAAQRRLAGFCGQLDRSHVGTAYRLSVGKVSPQTEMG